MVSTPTRKSESPKSKPEKSALKQTRAKAKVGKVRRPDVAWEKLPEDFVLPDDPVDNIKQPPLAAALTESLTLAGLLSETSAQAAAASE